MQIFGHRGARGLYPENTLEGFAAALTLGIDGIELDVAVTSDGIPVVSHDPALNPDLVRGADGAWLARRGPFIRDIGWEQLRAFDVGRARPGSLIAATYPDQRAFDGARIPRLCEALGAISQTTIVELKTFPDRPGQTVSPEAMAEAALSVAEQCNALGRVIFESFDWRGPRHLRRLRPDLRFAWLTNPENTAAARLWWDGAHPGDYGNSVPRAVAAEGSIWAPHHAELTQEQVAEAKELGLVVFPWTVNDPERMKLLLHWGVDGLISDRPDLAASLRG